jgi:peptidyl-prolyl cis-trans isomerase B (cyclophilin B)
MKRYITLAVLVLLAASCGGRRGQDGVDGDAADSLATAVADKSAPKEEAKPDTVASNKKVLPQEPIFDIVTTMGTIRVKLYKDTPKHRNNFIRLARTHFYENVLFHRVVDGFVIQGGDPYTRDTSRIAEWGEGGPGYTIDAEIVPEHTHKVGALAAARRGNLANPMKESSGSQFYLVQNAENCKHLDGEYTVFGETVGGQNVIDRIAKMAVDKYDRPIRPVRILRVIPNEAMNKKALEDERRALEEAENPSMSEENPEENKEEKKEETKEEKKDDEVYQLEVQTQVDSSVLRGRKLKRRK